MNPTSTSTPSGNYRPDLFRRFAELLVDGGLVTRREVEIALREARRARQPLGQWLIRNGRIPSRYLLTVRRLEALLVKHGSGLRLLDMLLETGEINHSELKRMQEIRMATGQSLVDILIGEGLLGRAPRARRRTLREPLAAAASVTVAAVCAWAILQAGPAQRPMAAPMTARSAAYSYSQHSVDLRFASLGNIAPHLQRLRQRPGPYRRPPVLTGSIRQRVKKIRPLVNQYAQQYELPPALILAVIEQESSFNSQAQSGKSGVGLMQLVPHEGGRAAYHYTERKSGTPTLVELQDPKTNIRLGTAYMRLLLDRHFEDIEDEDARVAIALAAYNWGPTRMRRVLRSDGLPDSMDEVEALLKKHAPVETQDYVRKITYRMDAFG